MTDDLIERLRAANITEMQEAADEIERLRALIASTRLPHCGCGRQETTAQLLKEDKT